MADVFYDGGSASSDFSTTDGAIDYTLPLGKVRLNILDIADNPADRLFTDVQLDAFYDANEKSVLRTSSAALLVIANSELLLAKKIRTQDLTSDGPAVSAELRALSREYMARARAEEAAAAESVFEVIPFFPADGPEAAERYPW